MSRSDFLYRRIARLIDHWEILRDRRQIERLKGSLKQCGMDVGLHLPLKIVSPEKVSLGDRVVIAPFVHIWGSGGVSIGERTLIASHVAITSVTHDPKGKRFRDANLLARVTIGDDVWIGTHAVILPGVTVGNGAIVAAGAVVRSSVPANSLFGGVPATQIQANRFDSVRTKNDETSG